MKIGIQNENCKVEIMFFFLVTLYCIQNTMILYLLR